MVVARAPDDRAEVGHTAWLAPYLSFARGAAVVLTHAQGPAVAEADVRELIRRESLQPRTVTILADYASIGYRYAELDPAGGEDEREEPPAAIPPAGPFRRNRCPAEPLPRQRDAGSAAALYRSHGAVRAHPARPVGHARRRPHSAGVAGRCLGVLRPRAAARAACWPIARRGC